MKRIIIYLLFIISLTTRAQESNYRIINKPEYLDVHGNCDSIYKIITDKNKTLIYFKAKSNCDTEITIPKNTYIIDENGCKYIVKKSSGIKIGKTTKICKDDQFSYSLTFPALPKGSKTFDFYKSDGIVDKYLLNIHESGTETTFSMSIDTTGINNAVNLEFPNNIFKKDTVWLSGKFNDTDLFQKHKQVINFIVPVPSIHGGKSSLKYEISPDGTFKANIPIFGPTWTELMVYAPENHMISSLIPIFLYPGDHITLSIDDYDTVNRRIKVRSELVKNNEFANFYNIFPTRHPLATDNYKINFDSLKNTITISEKAACYLSNKYKLSKAETGLLLTQANLSKVYEALQTVDLSVMKNRSKYYKHLNGKYPNISQKDTLQSYSKMPLYGITSLLRADNNAFLIVPSIQALARFFNTTVLFEAIVYDKDYFDMPQDYRHLFWKNQAIHMLRMNRNKPLGTDHLFEQWFNIANMEPIRNTNNISPNLKEIMNMKLENVTLPVLNEWKKEVISNYESNSFISTTKKIHYTPINI